MRLVALVLSLVVVGACRPSLDGAWEGTARCPGDTFPVSALLDEQRDGDVQGVVYIEGVSVIVGDIILRTDIEDGAYDAKDDEYEFDLQADDDEQEEFSVTLAIDDEDPDEASGDVVQFDDDGQELQTCDLALDRVSVADN